MLGAFSTENAPSFVFLVQYAQFSRRIFVQFTTCKNPEFMVYYTHKRDNERGFKMTKAIYFDMDGTIADLYGVDNWLDYLIAGKTKPYREARPLVNMRQLGQTLNALQHKGWHIGIISWLSKSGSEEYNEKVTAAKIKWLAKHLGAVHFDEIKIVKYGEPKQIVADFPSGILFDDEKPNRDNWSGQAYDVDKIMAVLSAII